MSNWRNLDKCYALQLTNSKWTQGVYLLQNIITIVISTTTLVYLYFGTHKKCLGISPSRKKMITFMLWIGVLGATIASMYQLIFIFDSNPVLFNVKN